MTGGRSGMQRFETPNNSRFLTFSCYHRLALFGNAAIRDRFADRLVTARESHRFLLFGWVVIPDHVHLLLMPDVSEHPMSRVLQTLKTPFAAEVIARWRTLDAPVLSRLRDSAGRTHFWQRGGGYDRNIRSRDDFLEKLAYIHANPVRRGLVARSTDWAWSSARWCAGDRSGPVELDPHRW